MKIIQMTPVHLADVAELAGDVEEKKNLKDYLKKFGKLNKKKADELAEEIRNLKNVKIKEEDVVKIVDFLPKDSENLNKIFKEISLDEKEANDLLEIIRRY